MLSDHAETVKRIFRLCEQGETLRPIADILNAEGIETKRGGDWHASTVRHILNNDKYRGFMRHEIGEETIERERSDLRL